MIRSNGQIVWTPVINRSLDVKIVLNRTFAEACRRYDGDDVEDFSEEVWNAQASKISRKSPKFLIFHSGILPKVLYSERLSLRLTRSSLDGLKRDGSSPMRYHGQNEYHHYVDRIWLMRAFGAWAEVATKVLKWK